MPELRHYQATTKPLPAGWGPLSLPPHCSAVMALLFISATSMSTT